MTAIKLSINTANEKYLLCLSLTRTAEQHFTTQLQFHSP